MPHPRQKFIPPHVNYIQMKMWIHCGHEYSVDIRSETMPKECPICAAMLEQHGLVMQGVPKEAAKVYGHTEITRPIKSFSEPV
jgi:hypothetical protein